MAEKEYIERGVVLELIAERNRNTCNGTMSCLQMKRMIENVPAADVAEVVRCKDCEYADGLIGYSRMICTCSTGMTGTLVADTDYCSLGKRKEIQK